MIASSVRAALQEISPTFAPGNRAAAAISHQASRMKLHARSTQNKYHCYYKEPRRPRRPPETMNYVVAVRANGSFPFCRGEQLLQPSANLN